MAKIIDVGRRSFKDWFDVFDVIVKNNNNYAKMREDNIITENFFIAWIFSENVVPYKNDELKFYKAINLKKKTTKFVVAELDNFKVIDIRKSFDNQLTRKSKEYKTWRFNVYKRDGFICQHCNKKNVRLNAHHIKPFSKYIELRTNIDNGITLCVDCHRKEHKRLRGVEGARVD